MKLLTLALVLGPTIAFAQSGLVPPGGGGTTPPPPLKCYAQTCDPPDMYGRPGQCHTVEFPCPVVPPSVPACVDIYGRVVPCPLK